MNTLAELLAHAEGVKESARWVKSQEKELNNRIKQRKVLDSDRYDYDYELERWKSELVGLVRIRVGLEKYSKKLVHQANEIYKEG